MNTSRRTVEVRPARRVRLVEQAGRVEAYPEPHRTPVLPAGWAPLTTEQQEAVLDACDAASDCLLFRVGSLWDTGAEYRVYRLTNESWGGLSVVARALRCWPESGSTDRCLIGLAWEPVRAVEIAVDFFNWDLEAHGEDWRLRVSTPGRERED